VKPKHLKLLGLGHETPGSWFLFWPGFEYSLQKISALSGRLILFVSMHIPSQVELKKNNCSADKSLISRFHQNSGRTNLGSLNIESDSYYISACFVAHKYFLLGYAFQLVRKWFSTVHITNVYTGYTLKTKKKQHIQLLIGIPPFSHWSTT
jgi:hypothetical protein